jgi:hypothetical protein
VPYIERLQKSMKMMVKILTVRNELSTAKNGDTGSFSTVIEKGDFLSILPMTTSSMKSEHLPVKCWAS